MENKVGPLSKLFAYLIVLVFILVGTLSGLYIEEYIYCYSNNIDFVWQSPWETIMVFHPGHSHRVAHFGMIFGFSFAILLSQLFLRMVYGREGADEIFGVSRKTYKPKDISLSAKNDVFDSRSRQGTETFKYKMTSSPYLKASRVLNIILYVFIFGSLFWTMSRLPKGLNLGWRVWEITLLVPISLLMPFFIRFFVGRGSIEISDEGITQITFYGKRSSILWSEIRELTERTNRYAGGMGVVDERGKTVIFILDRFDTALQIKARIFEEYKRRGRG